MTLSQLQRAKMITVLFRVFVAIFCMTAAFAFIGLAIVFVSPAIPEKHPTFLHLLWTLWGSVIAEVVVAILTLWCKFFRSMDDIAPL